MPTRRTPLHSEHLAAGARLVDFAGWEMPQQYTSVREEQEAVRTAAGIFDVSHMGRFEVRGAGAAAAEFLQGVVTNDVSRVGPNRSQYNLLCREDGGIIDDLVVYHSVSHSDSRSVSAAETWLVVVNASNRERDLSWLRDQSSRSALQDVEIVDRSDELSLIALQGPGASRLLPASGVDLDAVRYFGMTEGAVAGVPSLISRTGYTGEDGFELFVASSEAVRVWRALTEAGARPCGLAARDVCRLEAGLRLYGSDMDERTDPYEAGLGWTVKLEKGAFVGRDALRRIRDAGPRREIVGLRSAGRTIPRHDAAVTVGEREVGRVTSGTYSFWLGCGIAMASVEAGTAPVGSRVEVEIRSGRGEAEVVSMPFYRGSVRRAAPAQS
jgi:aminomethyltransferase